MESRPAQYTRSCMPGLPFGFTSTTTNVSRRVVDGDSNPVLFKWGTQVAVSCFGGTVGSDMALVFIHEEPDNNFLTASRANCVDDYNGCPWVDDTSGTSGYEGPLPGTIMKSGDTTYMAIFEAPFRYTPRAPTTRKGRCSAASDNTNVVGGPCANDNECGASTGVCVTDFGTNASPRGPDGAFISIIPTNVNVECFVTVCF